MGISSKSTRIFRAEDPVQETDLDLFSKVGQFKESQFDAGEKQLQDQINNWSMLRNVAKPQDKAYINDKLNSLVSGINNLGGVDLSDANNVNQLKSLGYNLYGDENVMAPVITTQKMNALSQDINRKLSGKDAKNYDSVLGEYQLHQYNAWLNDGKQGTSFDGPTSLQTGNFDQYNKKINDAISKLKPDENEAPKNADDAAFNYYQVGDKFIKKERISSLIDSMTSEQDRTVLNAHAWKAMGHLPDEHLLLLQSKNYDSALTSMKSQRDELNIQQANTTDFNQKLLFKQQIADLDSAISDTNNQKKNLPSKFESQAQREALQSSLFYDSYRNGISTANAYDQKKIELKSNVGKIAQVREAREAWQFSQNYNIKQQEIGLKKEELDIKKEAISLKAFGLYSKGQAGKYGISGPAENAPLSLVENRGDKDATKLSNDVITQADSNFVSKASDFYSAGYDYLMKKDADLWGKYLQKGEDGHWKPISVDTKKIADKGLQSAVDLYGNIANLSIGERNGLRLSDEDLELFNASKDLETATIYKNQVKDLTENVFKKAGKDSPYDKKVVIKLDDGTNKTLTYAELKELNDRKDPILDVWKKKSNFQFTSSTTGGNFGTTTDVVHKQNSLDNALKEVDDYYNDGSVKDAWKDKSKNFNVYGASAGLPKDKKGKAIETFAKPIADAIRAGTDATAKKNLLLEDIDLSRVYPVYDATAKGENKVKYMADVIYRKGEKGKEVAARDKADKITTVDLTNLVLQQQSQGGGYFSNLYPQDDAEVAYGMILNEKGITPLDAKTGYYGAMQTHSNGLLSHKYQIVSHTNANKGIDYYSVNVLIPLGKDKSGQPRFQPFPVYNTDANVIDNNMKSMTNRFPANVKYIRDYMDDQFKSSDAMREFYRIHGIPYNQQ